MSGNLHHFSNGIRVWAGYSTDVQFFVTLLLHFSYHLLQGATVPDGLKNLGGDAIGHALDAVLQKGLTLHIRFKYFVNKTLLFSYILIIIIVSFIVIHSIIYILYFYYLCVKNSCCMEKDVTDVMHTISLTGRIFQAGECATTHLWSTVETADHFH